MAPPTRLSASQVTLPFTKVVLRTVGSVEFAAFLTMDGALVAQPRVDATLVGAGQHELGEGLGVGLGTELDERSVVAGREDPPRSLALVPVLAHEHRAVVIEPEPHDRTLGVCRLRR